jgi:hypothetical protein
VRSFFLLLIPFLFSISAAGAAVDLDKTFDEANELYEKGNFSQARELYWKVVDGGSLSPKLCFNLGNAEFRLGNFGHACLWYRRAETLDPGMFEAKTNLRLLGRKVRFLEFEHDGLAQFVGWLRGSQWTAILVGGIWLFLLGTAILIVIRPSQPWSGILVGLTICGPLIATFGGIATYIHKSERDIASLGVVVSLDAVAVNGAFPGAEPVIELPPGSEVRIRETRGDWRFVYIPGEIAGWVDASDVEPLWPYERRP